MVERFVIGVLASVLSLWLMWRNRLDRLERAELEDEIRNHDYFVELDPRRKKINLTLLMIGVAFMASPIITGTWSQVIYWTIVVVLLCLMGMLALVDLQSSRSFLAELQAGHLENYQALEEELEEELDKFRQETAAGDPQANGKGLSQEKDDNSNT